MCEVETGTVQTLDIPSSLFVNKCGFSMDFGSTVLKVVYATELGKKIRLHFVSYPRARMDEAFQHIKDKIGDHLTDGQEVHMTGVGCNEYLPQIMSALGIKVMINVEFECHVNGFLFLAKTCSMEEFLHPVDPSEGDYARKVHDEFNKNGWNQSCSPHGMQPKWSWVNDAQSPSGHKLEFPAVLAMCGSAAAILKVMNEEGQLEMSDILAVCGRTLLGAGSLLAGANSFEELMSLAEKGSSETLDVLIKHIVKPDSGDGYATMYSDFPCFLMGHGVGKDLDSFSREDRAAAVVSMVSETIALWAHQWAHRFHVKHVYFTGGVHTNSKVMRDSIGKCFAYRGFSDPLGDQWIQHHFVKLGAYLGALGSLLKNLEQK